MSQLNQISMSKKAIYILLSLVSLFSFILFSYSTAIFPLLSPLCMKLFSYFTDRNYIFLFFNGILVFLLKGSSFMTNSSLVTDDIKNDHVKRVSTDSFSPVVDHIKSNQVEKTLTGDSLPDSYHIENNRDEKTMEINIEVRESSRVNPEVHTQETGQVLDTQEDDNENYVDEEREELNKRCEEFIRRMKQDIKIEATRRLTRIK